jgi:hypothetical protein
LKTCDSYWPSTVLPILLLMPTAESVPSNKFTNLIINNKWEQENISFKTWTLENDGGCLLNTGDSKIILWRTWLLRTMLNYLTL